jgi:hypothetical protein
MFLLMKRAAVGSVEHRFEALSPEQVPLWDKAMSR